MASTLYDVVPYVGWAQVAAHPDRLAALGRLLGLGAPAVERCRVLELGCGDGNTIISEAVGLPGARFVGIDLSAAAIERGQAVVSALGLKGVELKQMDLMAAGADLGEFDYIVAHGVYSWVPGEVRERMMEICRRHLSANGVVYISYNVLPGCRIRQVGWDLMRFHCAGTETKGQVARAREIVKLMAESAGEGAYGMAMKEAAERAAEGSESLIFHDDLAGGGTPMLFHEFAAHAAAHGLQYVCGAEFRQYGDPQTQPTTAGILEKLGETDLIRREQYADFVLGRAFRKSLLCRSEATLCRPVKPERLRGLRLASAVKATGGDPGEEGIMKFEHPAGTAISIGLPLAKGALVSLGEAWPQSVEFGDLLERARGRSKGRGNQEEEALGRFLLTALAADFVEVHSVAAPIVTHVSALPRTSALVRWQIRRGEWVTTLTGGTMRIEGEAGVRLLGMLDGTRSIQALCRELGVDRETLVGKLEELAKGGVLEG